MALDERYRRQVDLLLRLIPGVAAEPCFALKGGTAINLFVRNAPRLSVDIDLAYLPVADRATSLRGIEDALERIARRIARSVVDANIQRSHTREAPRRTVRLTVGSRGVQVKIEVTPVLRGCVFPPRMLPVTDVVAEQFGFAEMQVVSFADLYAGKIVAALDRQHPRDLFDVRDLLAAEGITDELRRAFVVYLISHDGRTAEVLAPRLKDIRQEYDRGFLGMTTVPVSLEELHAARQALVSAITGDMPLAHRRFLLDIEATGDADWAGLGLVEAQSLPAVRWRLQNLAALAPAARADLAAQLAQVLGIDLGQGR